MSVTEKLFFQMKKGALVSGPFITKIKKGGLFRLWVRDFFGKGCFPSLGDDLLPGRSGGKSVAISHYKIIIS